MKKHYNYLNIDLDKKIHTKLKAKQGDSKSRYILVNLISNNLCYDLTGTTVKIYGIKKDKTIFFNHATVTNAKQGQFEIELTTQALAVPGEIEIQILILGTNDEKLTTFSFFIDVEKTIIDDAAIESTNEFTALTKALSSVQNIDNRFREVDEQFNTITMLMPVSNGVDDTSNLQRFFNNLTNNSIVKATSEQYIISDLVLANKNNITFRGRLRFKVKDGANARNSNIRLDRSCFNISFDNLIIDGNSENQQVSGSDIGQFTVMMIDSSNVFFDYLNISNSIFCALSQNGYSNNIIINNLKLKNIGEHCLYRSAGGNNGFTINNLDVENFGVNNLMDNTHEVYIIKERCDDNLFPNRNLKVGKATVTQNVCVNRNLVFYQTIGSINVNLNNIELSDGVNMFLFAGNPSVPNGVWENIILDNFKISNGALVLNSTNFTNKNKGIIAKNGYLKGSEYLSNLTNFDYIENVIIDNVQINKHPTGEVINSNTITFKKCKFINYDKEYCRIGDFDSDINFIECSFNDKLSTTKTYAFYGVNSNRRLNFESCTGDFTNFTYFIYTVTNSNVRLKDCKFNNADIGVNSIGGLLEIYNTIVTYSRPVLCELWSTKFTKAILENLFGNDLKSRTKVTGQISFSTTESSKSITINGNDITLAPSLNYEHIKLYPNKPVDYALIVDTSTRTFTVTLSSNPVVTTVFNYVVDINKKGI